MQPTRATHGITAVAAFAAIMTGATACAQSDDPTTRATDAAAPADQESVAPASMIDFGDEPTLDTRYKQSALDAVGDGLITMVPTVLPDGWSSQGGGYDAGDPQWWRMEFTSPEGLVVLDQLSGETDDVLGEHQGSLEPAEDVDLTKWGIGTWSQWDNGDLTLLTREVKGSVIVVQGPDSESVSDLAKSLLPAEDSSRSSED